MIPKRFHTLLSALTVGLLAAVLLGGSPSTARAQVGVDVMMSEGCISYSGNDCTVYQVCFVYISSRSWECADSAGNYACGTISQGMARANDAEPAKNAKKPEGWRSNRLERALGKRADFA